MALDRNAVCRGCRRRLWQTHEGQDRHPNERCDPSGRVWWPDEERAVWLAQRQAKEQG